MLTPGRKILTQRNGCLLMCADSVGVCVCERDRESVHSEIFTFAKTRHRHEHTYQLIHVHSHTYTHSYTNMYTYTQYTNTYTHIHIQKWFSHKQISSAPSPNFFCQWDTILQDLIDSAHTTKWQVWAPCLISDAKLGSLMKVLEWSRPGFEWMFALGLTLQCLWTLSASSLSTFWGPPMTLGRKDELLGLLGGSGHYRVSGLKTILAPVCVSSPPQPSHLLGSSHLLEPQFF